MACMFILPIVFIGIISCLVDIAVVYFIWTDLAFGLPKIKDGVIVQGSKW